MPNKRAMKSPMPTHIPNAGFFFFFFNSAFLFLDCFEESIQMYFTSVLLC